MAYFEGSGPKVVPDLEQTFFPDTGYTSPAVGDPVYISGDNKVSLCTGANPAFVGFVQSIAKGGNGALNVYVFGHRIRCKNTSGGALSAGNVVTSGNGGITLMPTYAAGDITTTGVADPAKIAPALNMQQNRRGVVVVGGANNAQVQIIFG